MKAILVVGMPSICAECPLHYRKRKQIYRCEITHQNVLINRKPTWCPLRQIPDKAAEDLIKGLDAMEKMQSVEVRTVRRTE